MKSAFNITVLESHGYTAMYKFFSGEKGHNRDKKLFDWRGKQNITIQSIQFYFRFMLNGFLNFPFRSRGSLELTLSRQSGQVSSGYHF